MPDVFLRMPEVKGLVSVIVPVYKTGTIVLETIQSVLDQTYSNFELITIDDGSNDNTIELVQNLGDPRILVIRQNNQGMAQTRNNGLKIAQGEFVLFLDHDDVLDPEFLDRRLFCFKNNQDVGFVGGTIRTFPDNPKEFLSVAEDVEREMLFFDPRFLTTPSSYLIRHRVLSENGISFNTNLSSTADRFFLLQLNKVTHGKRVIGGLLNYRISARGFSQTLSPALVRDNELLFSEMIAHRLMPSEGESRFRALYAFMLAGASLQAGNYRGSVKYVLQSFLADPLVFIRRLTHGIE